MAKHGRTAWDRHRHGSVGRKLAEDTGTGAARAARPSAF
jgi:hypothetical protein